MHRGDLLTDLPALAARAPAGATLVIYHSAVLYQVPADQREQFGRIVRKLGGTWLANEAPGVIPGVAAPAAGEDALAHVLARDGHAVALTESHGTWLEWL